MPSKIDRKNKDVLPSNKSIDTEKNIDLGFMPSKIVVN